MKREKVCLSSHFKVANYLIMTGKSGQKEVKQLALFASVINKQRAMGSGSRMLSLLPPYQIQNCLPRGCSTLNGDKMAFPPSIIIIKIVPQALPEVQVIGDCGTCQVNSTDVSFLGTCKVTAVNWRTRCSPESLFSSSSGLCVLSYN